MGYFFLAINLTPTPDSVKVVGFFYIDRMFGLSKIGFEIEKRKFKETLRIVKGRMKLYAIAGTAQDDTLYLSKSNPGLFVDIIDVCCGQYIEEYQPRQSVSNVRYEWIPNHKRKKDDPRLIDTMDKLPKLSEV